MFIPDLIPITITGSTFTAVPGYFYTISNSNCLSNLPDPAKCKGSVIGIQTVSGGKLELHSVFPYFVKYQNMQGYSVYIGNRLNSFGDGFPYYFLSNGFSWFLIGSNSYKGSTSSTTTSEVLSGAHISDIESYSQLSFVKYVSQGTGTFRIDLLPNTFYDFTNSLSIAYEKLKLVLPDPMKCVGSTIGFFTRGDSFPWIFNMSGSGETPETSNGAWLSTGGFILRSVGSSWVVTNNFAGSSSSSSSSSL